MELVKDLLRATRSVQDAEAVLRQLDICDDLFQLPSNLSGGQQARVAIARALVSNPEVLILDEPCSSLHEKLKHRIYDSLRQLSDKTIVLMALHDREDTVYCGDKVFVLKQGRCHAVNWKWTGKLQSERQRDAEFWRSVEHLNRELAGP